MTNAFPEQPASTAGSIWQIWPLRFAAFFVVLLAAYVGCQLLIVFGRPHLHFMSADIVAIGFAAITAVVMIVLYRALVRWTEQRSAGEIGIRHAAPLLILGAVIGFLLFAAVCAVLYFYGAAAFHGFNPANAAVRAAAGAAMAAVGEEIVFRGAVFRLVEEGCGTLIALILSGALFGLIHAGNPGATTASTVAIALEAGVLLAAAYVLTRSLWLPIGLHFGWNFTEGGVFGTAVSGGQSHGLITTTFSGPVSLTGGAFGPEASIVAVGLCLVAALAMLIVAAQRGEWKPLQLRWRTG